MTSEILLHLHCRERCRAGICFRLSWWQCCDYMFLVGCQAAVQGICVRAQHGSPIFAGRRRVAFQEPVWRSSFDGLDDWLRERFFRHDGNADVIRQELAIEHGIVIGLRSVELRVRQWRRKL